jgi:hypothetical protein
MIDKHLILCTAVLACNSALGAATVVPDATYQITLGLQDGSGFTYTIPGSYTVGGIMGMLSGFPDAMSQTSVHGNKDAASGADAFLTYYFTVAGSTFGQTIPIDISGSLSASATTGPADSVSALAAISVTTALNGDGVEVQAASNGNGSASSSPVLHVDYYGGDQYQNYVILHTYASGYGGFATALADPYIYIDPSFTNASNYSIVVSQGIGNSPASATAPEPASFVLVGIALCTAGLLRRRRAHATFYQLTGKDADSYILNYTQSFLYAPRVSQFDDRDY